MPPPGPGRGGSRDLRAPPGASGLGTKAHRSSARAHGDRTAPIEIGDLSLSAPPSPGRAEAQTSPSRRAPPLGAGASDAALADGRDGWGDARDNSELKVVTGSDDHSRFCIAAGLVERATSKAVCAVLSSSLRTYGIPDEILTDNGKVFTGRFGPQPVEVLFDRICRENGISHRNTAPRSPTTTGKIERFHQSLRKEFLADRTFASLEAAQTELD